jgi:hypothetical protein
MACGKEGREALSWRGSAGRDGEQIRLAGQRAAGKEVMAAAKQ